MFHVGFIGINKQGITYEVLDATRAKQIKIRFDDGAEVITTRSYLLKGLPLHPTKGKMFKGDVHKDRHGLDAAYKVKKEEYAKVLAEKYKSTITKEAYDSLVNFKVKMYHHKPHECRSRT